MRQAIFSFANKNFFAVTVISLSILTLTGCQTLKGDKDKTLIQAKKTEQSYYADAKQGLNKGNYATAIAELNELRTFYPVGKHSESSLLDLMYAQFQHGDYLDAVASAERFIQLYPNNPQVDYAYYVRGVANMQAGANGILQYTKLNSAHRDMGYLKSAFNNFQELITKYPNSAYAPDSSQRMLYIYNQFAESEMNVARWYLKRKAYVAAANRAKWVFQNLPQSELIPESIATLAYSYEKLGMTDTAHQYKQLLIINYPDLLTPQGQVRLDAVRTKANWLNIATLGILGKGNEIGQVQQNSQYQGATKPQQIVNRQQLTTLQLPYQMEQPQP